MRVHIYRNYRFLDKDPIIDAIKTVVKTDEKLTNGRAAAISGVSATTLHNWFSGGTRRPQNASATQVTASLGYVRRDTLNKDGTVSVGFVRARSLDFDKEVTKQSKWRKNGRLA